MDDKLTTKDAITVLRSLQDWLYCSSMNGGTSIQREAIDIAIEALKQPKIGKWIDDGDPLMLKCSNCGYGVMRYNNTHFCPNCGEKKEIKHDG